MTCYSLVQFVSLYFRVSTVRYCLDIISYYCGHYQCVALEIVFTTVWKKFFQLYKHFQNTLLEYIIFVFMSLFLCFIWKGLKKHNIVLNKNTIEWKKNLKKKNSIVVVLLYAIVIRNLNEKTFILMKNYSVDKYSVTFLQQQEKKKKN